MKLGLIVNPVAGIGGPAGLKGSDGETVQKEALLKGARSHTYERTCTALAKLPADLPITVLAAPGPMGADAAERLGLSTVVVGEIGETTTYADTERIAALMKDRVDLLVFTGGDGTARNICNAVGTEVPVIGIPGGVKIHSAVYAVSPEAAGEVITAFAAGAAALRDGEVMDIDEDSYRSGVLRTRLFGYMKVPVVKNRVQNPKAASHNSDEDTAGICHEISDRIRADSEGTLYILGAGSTLKAVKRHLGFEGSLIGVDVYDGTRVIAQDVSERELLSLTEGRPCRIIVTVIGGQGHIFGRGNQQLSPAVIRRVGAENIWIVATGSKIYSLPNQQLYVDTGDAALDATLRGYRRVITGWQDTLVCRVL